MRMRFLCVMCVTLTCLAQTPTPPASETSPEMPRKSDIVLGVNVVIAPTTVVDRSGAYINGLQLQDFTLYDNDRPQRITADISFEPISLVIAVQSSYYMEEALPKIQRIGSMLDSLVLGENGEAAVMAFDHRIRNIQDFSSDSGKISDALKRITVGSSSSQMIDAVEESVRMLRKRPNNRRKIILLIGEARDKASSGRLREALTNAQLANVTIFAVDISHLITSLTTKLPPAGPNPIPATAHNMPGGGAQIPYYADIQQNSGNYIPLFVDIFKAAKGLFVDNTAQAFTSYTGGRTYAFNNQKGLDQAVSRVGEELHSQYLLSYNPDNIKEGGFHTIRIVVNRPGLDVRTRPGYWVAAQPQ